MTDDPTRAADAAMPVMAQEAERSRGRYRYWRDGDAVAVDERFVLGEVGPGAVRVRSTRITGSPTARLEVDVRLTAERTDALVRWTGSAAEVARSARAEYTATGRDVVVAREVDATAYDEVREHGALYPLMRVFTGPLVVASTAGLDVVVPDVADPSDLARFLAPVVSSRDAEVLGPRAVVVDGVEREGTAYRWTGGAYGEDGAEFVVDAGGLLLEYAVTQPSGRWRVGLAEVTGPWPAPLSWPRP
ncbi:MAG: hypothetical protein U0S36_11100 [Candidatus Nanopelagicales bacterium]